ncbi:hypothetical protein MKW98_007761 [Papaver atlanticum]|uniref:Uncharacterized protein n=1 Tax=Papaver atlanticum TaxID=357466 RepID=A0AAD4X5M8_9MAGN|nr:hypothetical protein MKW98_007761 [Papaver atlanticum]
MGGRVRLSSQVSRFIHLSSIMLWDIELNGCLQPKLVRTLVVYEFNLHQSITSVKKQAKTSIACLSYEVL